MPLRPGCSHEAMDTTRPTKRTLNRRRVTRLTQLLAALAAASTAAFAAAAAHATKHSGGTSSGSGSQRAATPGSTVTAQSFGEDVVPQASADPPVATSGGS